MHRTLWWIVAAAVALRLTFAFGVARAWLDTRPETETTDGYERIAEHLHDGLGYRLIPEHPPTLQRPPGYPFFLAGIFRFAGVDYAAVQVAQALLGGLCCWLLFLLGRWVLGPTLGLAAASLGAVHLTAIEYAARLYSENLYFPLFLAFALFLARAIARASARDGFLAGLFFGLGLLTRGTLLAFPPFLALLLYLPARMRPGARHALRWAVPALVATLVVIAPWAARNHRLTGGAVPVSAWGWAPFYHGIQCSKGMLRWEDLRVIDQAADRQRHQIVVDRLYGGDRSQAYRTAGEAIRHERVARDLVLQEIGRDPLGFVARGLVGIPFSWFQTLGRGKRVLSLLVHLPLFVLFLAGARSLRRREPAAFARAWPALLLVSFVTLFQAFVFPFARYLAPAVALSFLFSGYALLRFLRRERSCA